MTHAQCTCGDPTCHAPYCPAGQEETKEINNYNAKKDYTTVKTLAQSLSYSGESFDDWWEMTGKDLYGVLKC